MNGFVLIILILLLIATVAGIVAAVAIPIARSRHPQRSVLTNSWVKANGNWYFVDEAGVPLKERWIETDAGRCYVGPDGARLSDTAETIDGKLCRFDVNGYYVE